MANEQKLPKPPEGYFWTAFGGSGDDKGTVIVGGRKIIEQYDEKQELADGCVIPMPEPETVEEHAETRKHEVMGVDGKVRKYEGHAACVATAVPHDYEQIRGEYRAMLVDGIRPTPDAVRESFRQVIRPGEKVEIAALDAEAVDQAKDKDALVAMLKEQGLI